MIEEIVDDSGNVRRLGSLIPESLNVCGAPTFAEKYPAWSDEQIREAITDPNRKPSRLIFGDKWIHNQGSFGSCCGCATAGTYARARYLRGIKDQRQFSGSFVYAAIHNGSDSGAPLALGMKTAWERGFAPVELVKTSDIYKRLISAEATAEAEKHKALKRTTYHISTLRELRTALAMGLPCVVAIQAGRNFQRLNSQGIAGCDSGRGNHAVLLDQICMVGGHELFDMSNSWGLQYGNRGRAYLTADHFEQTIAIHDYYAIGDVEEIE